MAATGAGLVWKLDVGGAPTTTTSTGRGRPGSRLAPAAGPAKYRALARRRRLAQIKARHVLDALASEGRAGHPRLREVG